MVGKRLPVYPAQIKYGNVLSEILEEVDEDFGWNQLQDLERSNFPAQYKKGKDFDGFLTFWYCEQECICGIPIESPVDSYEKMDGYQWPVFSGTPPSTRLYSGHVLGSKEYYSRGAWITFFEQLQRLRGDETMMDLMVAPDGGIIACGEIDPDIPLENIRAMYKTFFNYKY